MKTGRLLLVLVLGVQVVLTPLPRLEAAAPATLRAACTVNAAGGADYTSIQAAVDDATCDTITIAAGSYEESLVISRDVTLVGAGAANTTLDYSIATGRALHIADDSITVAISDMTITAIFFSGNGGCIYNEGDLTLTGVTVIGCQATDNGGGIYNEGDLTLIESTVAGNMASYGGGVYHAPATTRDTLTVIDSIIEDNIVASYGGGIYIAQNRTASIADSLIQENYAEYGGGGINNSSYATLAISGTQILNNSASETIDHGYGGGIWNNGALAITNTLVQGNSSAFIGGGIYANYWGTITLNQSQVLNNSATSNGGGIYANDSGSSRATTIITGSEISGNTAAWGAGIDNKGVLSLENSIVSNNVAALSGGGIKNSYTLVMTNTACTDNTAGQDGGGVYDDGTGLWLTDVTLQANVATGDGGGLYAADIEAVLERVTLYENAAGDDGGGIHQNGVLTLTNSTLSANTAYDSGGGVYNNGDFALNSVTLAYNIADSDADGNGNGGGIFQYGSLYPTVYNTLVGKNSDNSSGTDHPDCSGTFTSRGYNLIRDNTGCNGFVIVYDHVGTSSMPLEPRLLPLGNYGGATLTHALRYTARIQSPAVDSGPTTGCPATDQRGVARPIDRDGDGTAECDIGAVELEAEVQAADLQLTQNFSAAVVAPGEQITVTLTFTNAGPYDATGVVITDTLPAPLAYVSAVGSGVVITPIVGSHYAWNISDLDVGTQASLQIRAMVATNAASGAVLINTASIASAQEDPSPTDNTSAGSVTVGACFATPNNGATVYRSADAQALRDALAAAASGATVKIAGTCAGVGSDSAVALIATDLTLRGGYAVDDWSMPDFDHPAILDAESTGRVLSIEGATVTLENLQLTGGQSSDYGGGVYIKDGIANLYHLEIVNSVAPAGGAIYANASTFTLSQTHILSNTANTSGGGVYLNQSEAHLYDVIVAHNATLSTGGVGGGLCVSSGAAYLTNTLIYDNAALYGAGGLYVGGSGAATVQGGRIYDNNASSTTYGYGGGVYVSGAVTLTQVVMYNNNAAGSGGALYNVNGDTNLTNVTLSGNTAQKGAALYNAGSGTTSLTFTTLADNVASDTAGGIYLSAGSVTLHNSLLSANSPENCYGGITSNGYNLANDASCNLAATGDLEAVDPQLGALQGNGGGTLTHALQPSSPAADAGWCVAGITTDQRGYARPGPSSALCDIGAYEATIVATPADVTLSKAAASSIAAPGDAITYTLRFTNTGGIAATGVFITDTLPSCIVGTAYISSGASVTLQSGTRYVWRVANLAPGAGGVITITGVVRVPCPAGQIANTATIAARNETNTANNSATVQVTVPNVAPVAHDATTLPVDEEATRVGVFQASDANGDPLTFGILIAPTEGSVGLLSGGRFVYTPTNRMESYTDTFTYGATDSGSLSAFATITVPVTAYDDPSTISNIPNQRTNPGVAVGPLPFIIDDVDTPIVDLTLTKTSTNTTLVPTANITFGGSGKNRTVTIAPVAGLTGTATIYVGVHGGSYTVIDRIILVVGTSNSTPNFTSAPVTAATEDTAYAYPISVSDLDAGDALAITAVTKPAWLMLIDHHNRTATLGGTPRNGDVGAHTVTLRVVDNHGASETQTFTVTVANTNDAPIAHPDTASTNELTVKAIYVLANDNDPDGDALTVTAVGTPAYGAAGLVGDTVIYTPTNRAATYTTVFTYTISDGTVAASANVTVTVNAINDPPVIAAISDKLTQQNTPVGPFPFVIGDADTPAAALTLSQATSNPTLAPLSAIVFGGSADAPTLTITPTWGVAGVAFITITVSDGTSTDFSRFRLEVLPNNPPVFVSAPLTITLEGGPYHYDVFAVDVEDGETSGGLTYSAPLKPGWLTFSDNGDNTAALGGIPQQIHVGEHPVRLRVVDTDGGAALQVFTITVVNINDAPIARDDFAVTDETQPKLIPVLVNDSDPDADILTLAAVSAPLYGNAIISGSAVLYLPVQSTATYADVFSYTISDGALTAWATVTVTVNAADAPPTISDIRNARTESDTPVGPLPFWVMDLDTPLDALVLGKVSSNPALLPLANIAFGGSGANRTVTLTPTVGLSGTALITITVRDATSTVADSFTVAVAVNTPPEFVSAPLPDAIEGRLYAYSILAADIDPSDVLTLTAPLAPAWLTLEPLGSGRAVLLGTPPDAAVGAHAIQLQVADRAGATATQTYTLTVHPRNQRPWANAGPDQIVAPGALVTLDGSESGDPDAGDTLSYGWVQVYGLPVTLNDSTAISPTFTAPGDAVVLTFSLIVTDSLGLASLPDTVTITVEGYRIYLPLTLRQ